MSTSDPRILVFEWVCPGVNKGKGSDSSKCDKITKKTILTCQTSRCTMLPWPHVGDVQPAAGHSIDGSKYGQLLTFLLFYSIGCICFISFKSPFLLCSICTSSQEPKQTYTYREQPFDLLCCDNVDIGLPTWLHLLLLLHSIP